MSRSKRFFGGLILSYAYQGTLVLAGLMLTPFYLRHIGQHDYGLWLLGTQLLTYLTLTDFGVVALLPLEAAYATGRSGGIAENASELSAVVGRTARLVLYQLPIVIAIAIGMWFTIPAEWQGLRGPLAIVLVGFVIAFPLRILPALLHGLQDLTFTGIMQILTWMISTAATIAMVMAGWSLVALAVGWLITQVVMTPVFLYRMATRFPGILPRRLPPLVWDAVRPQLGKGFWISVAQVAQLLVANTDLLIIGKLLGPLAVVPYSCTGKLAGVLTNQAQVLMQTATPGLCELKSIGSREKLFHALVAMTNGVMTFSGLVFCVVILVNQRFVTSWVTGRQYGGMLLTIALALNFLIRSWTGTTAFSVFCFGYQRRISLTNISDGAVSVVLCIVLTMLIGPVGAAAGSILGACLVSLPLNLRVMASDTGVTVPRLLSAMLRGWSWRFALIAGSAFYVAMRWPPRNLLEAAAGGLVVAVAYILIMLPNILHPPLGNYIRPLMASFRVKYTALQMRLSS